VDSIAEAMRRILDDADLRHELIERGLQRSACFSTRSFSAKILDVYRSLL
jgi:glycosyltransferase involved in cell wall biosynthesis